MHMSEKEWGAFAKAKGLDRQTGQAPTDDEQTDLQHELAQIRRAIKETNMLLVKAIALTGVVGAAIMILILIK